MKLHITRKGLISVAGGAVTGVLVGQLAMSLYSKVGPFINGSAPGIDQVFLNGMENYFNSGAAKSGVPIASYFGPYSVTTTPTFFNHNLKDQTNANVTPSVVLVNVSGTSISTHCVEWESGSLTSTQVKLTSDGGTITVWGVAFKF
jgi:hypothetical protein